jgi:outer membrane protein assembly factor BamB
LLAGTGGGDVYGLTLVGYKFGTGSAGGNISAEPGVFGGNAFFTTWNGRVCAVSSNGTIGWSRSLADMVYTGPGRCSPRVIGGVLVVTTGVPQILGLSPDDGHTLWSVAEKASYASPETWRVQGVGMLGMGKAREYAVIATMDGRVCVLDPGTGRKLFEIPCDDAIFSSRVAVAGDRAYLAGMTGKLYALDLKRRTRVWTAALGGDFVFSDPVASGRMVYLGTMSGALYALEDISRLPANATGRK